MSRKNQQLNDNAATSIAAGAAALLFPPILAAAVPTGWTNRGIVGEFDLNLWCTTDSAMTAVELFGAIPRDILLADDDVDTVDFANNELDLAAHIYETGDGPVRLTTTGTLPTGLALLTDYFVIKTNSGTIQLAATLAQAYAADPVTFSDDPAGTHTISDVVSSTKRMYWHSYGLLGEASSGIVTLTKEGRAYSQRAKHNPRVTLYAVIAGGTVAAVDVEFSPVVSI